MMSRHRSCGSGKNASAPLAVQPDLCFGVVEVAGNLDIGQNEKLRISRAREGNSQLLANCAGRPVTPEEPVSLEFLDPVAGAQPGRDAGFVLRQCDQFGVALDPHPVPG
jgi:hypothetical protein